MTTADMERLFVSGRNFSQFCAKNDKARKFDVLNLLFGKAGDEMFFPLLLLVGLPAAGVGAFLSSASGGFLFIVAVVPLAALLSKVVVQLYQNFLYSQLLREARNLSSWLGSNFGLLVSPYDLVSKDRMSIITHFYPNGLPKQQMLAQQDDHSFLYLGPNFTILDKVKFSVEDKEIQECADRILALLEQLKNVDSTVEVNHIVSRVENDYDQLVQQVNAMNDIDGVQVLPSLQYLQAELEVAAENVQQLNRKALAVHNGYIRSRQDGLNLRGQP